MPCRGPFSGQSQSGNKFTYSICTPLAAPCPDTENQHGEHGHCAAPNSAGVCESGATNGQKYSVCSSSANATAHFAQYSMSAAGMARPHDLPNARFSLPADYGRQSSLDITVGGGDGHRSTKFRITCGAGKKVWLRQITTNSVRLQEQRYDTSRS